MDENAERLRLEMLMEDPAASESLKAVVNAWIWRDVVDAAHDAEALHRLFSARADMLLGGRG